MASLSDDPLRVHLRPAWDSENAFCRLLADGLVAQNLDVREMAYGRQAIPAAPGIAFLHWPNEIFFRRGAGLDARTLLLLLRVAISRRRHGLRVVWLAHNIIPHERDRAAFTVAQRIFFHLLDGLVFLSESSRSQFLDAYPRLASLPHLVIAHGHYRPSAIAPPSPPRPIDDRAVRMVLAGRVKAYKSPEALAAATATLPGVVETVIAGGCDEPVLRASLTDMAERAPNLTVRFGFLPDDELERVIDAGDAVITPYRDILNSGSALYALSRNRPFIAPRLGSLIELQQQVGAEWVWLYDGPFTADTLAAAAKWVATTPRPSQPDLSAFDWDGIAHELAIFLRDLGRKDR